MAKHHRTFADVDSETNETFTVTYYIRYDRCLNIVSFDSLMVDTARYYYQFELSDSDMLADWHFNIDHDAHISRCVTELYANEDDAISRLRELLPSFALSMPIRSLHHVLRCLAANRIVEYTIFPLYEEDTTDEGA